MSAFGKMKLGVAAASVACLAAGIALAQQAAGQREATQLRDDVPGRAATDQSDRATRPQQDRIRTTQRAQFGQRNLQLQAGVNPEVEKFLAACLLQKNKGEVELGQLAQQQSQNPQVKQFAQQMVQDHQQLVQQLQQIAGSQAGQTSTRIENETQSISASGQNDAQRQPSDTTRLPGSPGATQTTRGQTLPAAGGSQEMSGPFAQLAQIEKQIAERHQQAIKDELQQKSGLEFDKCFVGSQVAAHMHMLAALEVISQQQGELGQLAQQVQGTVQQHLDHSKQLAKQLESGSQTGSQAERQTPPRTQRQ